MGRKDSPWGFTLDFLLFCAVLLVIASVLIALAVGYFEGEGGEIGSAVIIGESGSKGTVVIDAGHGGEDGGAIGRGAIYEKDLNLDIALKMRDELERLGYKVIMTREEDILLYDRNSDYEGHKKSQDLKKRLEIADANPDAVFVSIHMNAFPDASCKGLQVWYSKNTADGYSLAEKIQSLICKVLQEDNHRKVKAADSTIYLLSRAASTAVLIECGFLSNEEELELLSDENYRKRLAELISSAIDSHFSEREGYFKE